MKAIFSIMIMALSQLLLAQGPFAGALGSQSSIAIHADSTAIVDWAASCNINRGWMDVRDTSLGKVSVGEADFAEGYVHDKGVISLGDGGVAILQFNGAIYDGPGADFAIFENSFSGQFLELAFVEVSSDGQHFVRFPAYSLTDTNQQVGSFGLLDPTEIHNLAGKYPLGYGTPFDLAELKDSVLLDIQNITHIKIIDVVGSLDPNFLSRDANGRAINDPFPTPFPSGGFDLDGVGVIHIQAVGIAESEGQTDLKVFPNPFNDRIIIDSKAAFERFEIYDLNGRLYQSGILRDSMINTDELDGGTYLIRLISEQQIISKRLVKW